LRALCHLAAVFLQFLRQLRRAHAALPVARHGVVDELRIRQVQPGHDLLELLERLAGAQARIAFLLLRH
jgi:hypothetical protein